MAAAEIQIVNPSNLAKIESFLNDPSYKEIIENSSTFNSRLCAERRMRMPFIDTQTGVAQNHCNLFVTKRQRLPGQKEGQVYTYPAQRWRKSRRQYLTMSSTRWGWTGTENTTENVGEGENSSGIPGEAPGGDDSRDGSQTAAKDDPKEWFYDELALEEMETGEEPDPESDEDYYDDTYANRRKRRGGVTPTGPGSRGGRTRNNDILVLDVQMGECPKAILCCSLFLTTSKRERDVCGAKYKTRPGLTYHFTHTHKEAAAAAAAAAGGSGSGSVVAGGSDGDSRDSRGGAHTPPVSALGPATEYQDSYVTFLNNPAGAPSNAPAANPAPVRRASPPPRPASADTSSSDSAHAPLVPPAASAAASVPASTPPTKPAKGVKPKPRPALGGHSKASPSPYCDFCLGDDRKNKKTGTPEQLVSCSDCGRSGNCFHSERRACERHRHLADGIRLNGLLEILTSVSYPADAFDTFATQTKLLKDDYKETSIFGNFGYTPE
ncbi:Requim [Operophtera brumata]|uniref:Requim n=1 Tax=Operophtera brumata TaxID=104452 RepID=A0A0L7LIN0_OPEBR|nr:Requim [Operophtera brumata]